MLVTGFVHKVSDISKYAYEIFRKNQVFLSKYAYLL